MHYKPNGNILGKRIATSGYTLLAMTDFLTRSTKIGLSARFFVLLGIYPIAPSIRASYISSVRSQP